MKKTYRIKLKLDGDNKERVYRTDGVLTFLCSYGDRGYFCWEKSTKYNDYQAWSGYIGEKTIHDSIKQYNPDKLFC